MRTWLKNFFLKNWERKSISVILAVILWLVVNASQISQKTFENVAVRIINLPSKTTVEGLLPNSMLSKRISLTMVGKKSSLEELTSNDFEIVLDSSGKSGKWQAPVSHKNLVALNPDTDILKGISRILPCNLSIVFAQMLKEKIPIVVTLPIGEAPRNYQFLDVWPYHLSLTVSGPEQVIKQLKAKGLNLTLNLNHVASDDLETLQHSSLQNNDEISFPVPEDWKKISIPSLSDEPFEIDDPQAKNLRIDFVRSELHPLNKSIPITLFYPTEYSSLLCPVTYSIQPSTLVDQKNGIALLQKHLCAKGVSKQFVDLVRNMLEIAIILSPENEHDSLDWSLQFINPRVLEDKYVSILLTDSSENDLESVSTKKQEEYLRNRFRKYMNQFELYTPQNTKFHLQVKLRNQQIYFQEKT